MDAPMRLPETVYNEVLRGLGLQDHGISTCLREQADANGAEAVAPAVEPGECKRPELAPVE